MGLTPQSASDNGDATSDCYFRLQYFQPAPLIFKGGIIQTYRDSFAEFQNIIYIVVCQFND